MLNGLHYLLRETYGAPPPPVQVRLKGQFDQDHHPAAVGPLRFYGRSVRKLHGGAPTPGGPPYARLAFYRLAPQAPEPPRAAWVHNQFGPQHLLLGMPVGLLVPAQTLPGGPHVEVDHYKVYDVLAHDPVQAVVTLDEGGGSPPFTTEVHRARFFAVPVEKIHGDRRTPILHRHLHLTLYDVLAPWTPLQEEYRDQFVPHQPVQTYLPRLLVVPSAKLGWGRLHDGALRSTEDPIDFIKLEYRWISDHHILDANNVHPTKAIETKVSWTWYDGKTETKDSATLTVPAKTTMYAAFYYDENKDSRIRDYKVESAKFV
jgi:hypothetical protein